jgi:putative PIN family toxin of toxin-antitoxin system
VRVFLDTNVLVAAFATRGLCPDLFRTVLAEHEPLSSATVCEELSRILTDKVRVSEGTVREIDALVRASASFPEAPGGPLPVVIRDPADAVILAEATALRADVLVTGDKDLLEAGEVPGIRILNPRGFWELVRREGP